MALDRSVLSICRYLIHVLSLEAHCCQNLDQIAYHVCSKVISLVFSSSTFESAVN